MSDDVRQLRLCIECGDTCIGDLPAATTTIQRDDPRREHQWRCDICNMIGTVNGFDVPEGWYVVQKKQVNSREGYILTCGQQCAGLALSVLSKKIT